jgi:uncharacterized protein YuzE
MGDSIHFVDMLREREIRREWVVRAERNPDYVEERADGTRHFIKLIPENGNRWLRVVVNSAVLPHRRVTAFFDGGREGNMRIKVDKETDALYFRLDESKVVGSEKVQPGVILDFDENDRVVGAEFLGISKRAPKEELSSIQFQTV